VLFDQSSGNNFHCQFNSDSTKNVFGEIYKNGKFTRFHLKSYCPNQEKIEINKVSQPLNSNTQFESDDYTSQLGVHPPVNGVQYVRCTINYKDVFGITPSINPPDPYVTLNIDKLSISGDNYGFRLIKNNIDKSDPPIQSKSTVSVQDEADLAKKINFTNPVYEKLYINFFNKIENKVVIRIYNTNLSLFCENVLPFGSQNMEVDMLHAPSGIYLLKIEGDGFFNCFKIFKR
jgi:hypothetical protein